MPKKFGVGDEGSFYSRVFTIDGVDLVGCVSKMTHTLAMVENTHTHHIDSSMPGKGGKISTGGLAHSRHGFFL